MSSRDRLHHFAIGGLIALATFAVLALASTVWLQYQTGRRAYQEYQHGADTDQKETANKIAEICGIEGYGQAPLRHCLRQQIDAYQKQDTTNKDLQAQQDMAYWAMIAAAVAFGGLVLSTAGLGVVVASLRQTRQAIVSDREIGEAQIRAYLYCKSATYKIDNDSVTVTIEIANAGQSPASDVFISGTVTFNEVIGVPDMPRVINSFTSDGSETQSQPIIASGSIVEELPFFGRFSFLPDDTKAAEERKFILETANEIAFHLTIKWSDVFKQRHDFAVILYAVIGPSPNNFRKSTLKKRVNSGRLDFRMEDARHRVSAAGDNGETK